MSPDYFETDGCIGFGSPWSGVASVFSAAAEEQDDIQRHARNDAALRNLKVIHRWPLVQADIALVALN